MHLRTVLLTCLIFFSYQGFSQTDNNRETGKHRYSIEPYILSGLMNTVSDINKRRFQVMSGINIGMDISKRSSLIVGANYSQVTGIYHGSRQCGIYPCPDAEDYKFINVSLGYKFDAFSKSNISVEPFVNLYREITIYQLDYYYHNKENEQWVAEYTPIIGPCGFTAGAYLNYSISDYVEVFASPSFSYLFSTRSNYLIGSSFGTRFTF
ncbi:MAG: hypothetical protein IIA45_01410 [Bacteroidetes bacterium]|nr:hypothetical protein [Bacteroidota bacterium]